MLMTLIQFLLLDHGLSCYASESKVACEGDGSVAMKSYHEGLTDVEYVSNAMADAAMRLTACCVLWSCFCPRREHTRLVRLRYSCTLSRPGFVNVHLSMRRKSISLRSRFTLFPAKKPVDQSCSPNCGRSCVSRMEQCLSISAANAL